MAYPALKTAHSLAAITSQGTQLELEDGSTWRVYEGFAGRCLAWSAGEMIRVKLNRNRNPDYPYLLINVHRNEQVEAGWLEELGAN